MAKVTTRAGNVSLDLSKSAKYLHQIVLTETANSTNRVVVEVRDGSSGGTLMLSVPAAAGAITSITLDHPILCSSGVYLNKIGSGTSAYVVVTS